MCFMKVKIVIMCLLLTGCFEADLGIDPVIIETDLPCIDGWQFDYIGQPIVNPDTGAQLMCGWRLNEVN